jgi:hypothetical protein
MTTGIVWDERYAWHDAGLASSSPWAEPYQSQPREHKEAVVHAAKTA